MAWHSDLLLLAMLVAANGAPVVAAFICGRCWRWTVDGLFGRGRVVFGRHKTLRGIAAAFLAAVVVAWSFGASTWVGLIVGATAMLGDLGSSFIKRRAGIAPGGQVLGLDQIPESLLPALAAAIPLRLSALDVAVVVGAFCALELLLTHLWYRRLSGP